MNEHNQDKIKRLLQQALPSVSEAAEPSRDLWPALLHRIDDQTTPHRFAWVLFDAALLAGLVAIVAIVPASIPVLLYYL